MHSYFAVTLTCSDSLYVDAQPALEKAARVVFPEILAYAMALQQADEAKEWTKSEVDELLASE